MKLRLTLLIVAILVVWLVLTGCERDGALFGGAGALAGGIARTAGASNSGAVTIGLATGAAVGQPAYTIAKHETTERQRRVAEERARLAYANANAPRKARYRKTRYIAVDTVREKDSAGAQSVMIYDTQTQKIVGNEVYDVKQTPKDGALSKFDSYSAEYAGTGAADTPTPPTSHPQGILPRAQS
jgi:hypothetical protein